MLLLKLLLKAVLLPVILALTILEWVGVFLTSFGSVILFILSGIVFLIAILSWTLQIAPVEEIFMMLTIAFAVFMMPHVGEWLVGRIAALNVMLKSFIRA
jgi:hypothetical protein